MTRTEFYQHLAKHGRGQFVVDKKGRLRVTTLTENDRTQTFDPLSYVAWKLHGVCAPQEIERPAAALAIKQPLRLVMASDLLRGYYGSTRRAMLKALSLAEVSGGDAAESLRHDGLRPRPRSGPSAG